MISVDKTKQKNFHLSKYQAGSKFIDPGELSM